MKPTKFVMHPLPFAGKCDRCRRCTDLRYCQYTDEFLEKNLGFLCSECAVYYTSLSDAMTVMGMPLVVDDGLGARFGPRPVFSWGTMEKEKYIMRSEIPVGEPSEWFTSEPRR